MKRFFTFLMVVWALLSISQTVKATDYYITGFFAGESEWTKLDGKNMESVGNNKYSQTYQCTKSGEYNFRFTGDGLGYEMCPHDASCDLTQFSSYGVASTKDESKANYYFYVNMESGKTYTFTFDNSDSNNRTVACTVGGSSSTETSAKYYLVGSMNDWGNVEATSKNYPFTTTDNVTYTCTLSGQSGLLYFKPKSSAGGTWLAPGASNAYITTEYQSTTAGNGAWMLEASSDKTYTITLDCSNASAPQIKYSEQGSSVTPPTPSTNPIANRKYSEGYYLVGNFFNFDGEKINYKDAVFKFKQQKDDKDGNAVYMLEIPATLTARAQVMSVDATRTPVAVYGPGIVRAINNSTLPVGEDNQTATTGIQNLTPSTEIVDDGTNCWDMTTRRTKRDGVGQDGSYKYYITVDPTTGEPRKWEIQYTDLKRVAYLLSTNPLGSALTVGSTRVKNTFESENDKPQAAFNSGKFFGSLYMDNDDEYYGVSNDLATNGSLSSSYYGYNAIENEIDRPTYDKLFLFGNGGLDITQSDEAKKAAANWGTFKCPATSGIYVLEFNTNKGNGNNEAAHGGTGAEIHIVNNSEIINSLSMVGPAIPGTTTADGKWIWGSDVADMDFDVSENCYKLTIATTDDNKNQVFRFVGNHTQMINWFENSNVVQSEMAAKYNDDGTYGIGHTASPSDPNEVSYTQDGLNKNDKSNEDNLDILWNRPAGTWTVRFHIYTYSQDGNNPSFRYFYTINKNSNLELRDFKDVVYMSEENVRNIKNRGVYQYFRTWSDDTAWKRPKNVDVFVVSEVTAADANNHVGFKLKNINNFDSSEDVIPAKTGVILALKENVEVPGAVFHKRKSLITYNTLDIQLEQAKNKELSYTGEGKTNLLVQCFGAKNIPTEDKENVNYLFGFYHAIHGLGLDNATYKQGYNQNDYLLGFWISNGKGLTYANSSYLPIKKEIAEKLNLGTRNDFDALQNQSGSAKKIPALFFDFGAVDNDVTGIQGVVESKTVLDGKYYTLSGQQVEHPTVGGIYIHNGKKYVIK
jgi:hypothetical protein